MHEENLEQHIPMIQTIVNGFYIPNGLERDDLVQAGLIGVWKAAKKYKANKKVRFTTYAYVAARNEILSLLEKQSKYQPEQYPLQDADSLSYEIEQDVLDRLMKEDLEQHEHQLVNLLYEGYTQRQIAKILHTSQPRICQRIRQLRIKGKRKWGGFS